MKYIVEVQACQEIEVEAESADDARIAVIDGLYPSIMRYSCNDMGIETTVSCAGESR